MARFKADEISDAGFYWMKKSGKTTIVEIKNIPLTLGVQNYDMLHILKPGSMGWMPLHEDKDAKFNGPIKPPRGFENDPKPTR